MELIVSTLNRPTSEDLLERMRASGSDLQEQALASPEDTVNISAEGRAMQQGSAVSGAGLNKTGQSDGEELNTAADTKEFIQRQIQQLKREIQETEAKLAKAMGSGNTGSITGNAEAEAIQAELDMLNQQLMVLQQQLMEMSQSGAGGVGGISVGIGGAATGASGQGQRISVSA